MLSLSLSFSLVHPTAYTYIHTLYTTYISREHRLNYLPFSYSIWILFQAISRISSRIFSSHGSRLPLTTIVSVLFYLPMHVSMSRFIDAKHREGGRERWVAVLPPTRPFNPQIRIVNTSSCPQTGCRAAPFGQTPPTHHTTTANTFRCHGRRMSQLSSTQPVVFPRILPSPLGWHDMMHVHTYVYF